MLEKIKNGIENILRNGNKTIPKNETLRTLGFDYVEKHIDNEKDFLEFLKEKEAATSRAIMEAKNVEFLSINAGIKAKLKKAGYSDELIENTINNTCLAVRVGRKYYLLASSAMPSLKQKAFSRFDCISPELKATFLNATVRNANSISGVQDDVIPMVTCGKMASIMSGLYGVIVPYNFFASALESVKKQIGSYDLIEAICSAVSYRVKLVFTGEKAQELQKLYKEKLTDYAKRRNITLSDSIKDVDLRFGIVSGTDEAGAGAAFLRPYVNVGTQFGFEIGTPISVCHKGTVCFDNLETQVENMFSAFSNVVEKLSSAILTDIKNWRAVLDAAAQELRIPDDVVTKLILQFAKDYPGTESVTAYDIMMAILTSSNVYKNVMQPSDNAFSLYEARIAGVVNFDLAKFDFDPFALETELKSQPINDYMRVLDIACQELRMPKTISNSIITGFEAKVGMERLMNSGEMPNITAWDIYQAIMGAGKIYRDFLASRSSGDMEDKATSFERSLRRARKLCYVKYDVA